MEYKPAPGPILRVDLSSESLGFERPPVPVQMRFLRRADAWTLLALFPAGSGRDVASWIQRQTQNDAVLPTTVAPRTLRCELTKPPATWMAWLEAAAILQIDLTRHGTATVFLRGGPEAVAELAASLGPKPVRARQRTLLPDGSDGLGLTHRQLEVLCNAVAMGYYDVPHRVDLRELGRAMGLSVSSVSQLLRRAQGHIIRHYVDSDRLNRGRLLSADDPEMPPTQPDRTVDSAGSPPDRPKGA